MIRLGDRFTATVERPAAGGRMIVRHDGAVVFVSAAIPGETVEVIVDRVQRNVAWGHAVKVVEVSPDRIAAGDEHACGGNVLAHVRYERQLSLKRDIVVDAMAHIARLTAPPDLPVAASPVDGHRMRARLHRGPAGLGFFREGTHALCDPEETKQLLPETVAAMRALARVLESIGDTSVREVEVSENCPADQRAIHLLLAADSDPSRLGAVASVEALSGASCGTGDLSRSLVIAGEPVVRDRLAISDAPDAPTITLQRHAHSFFQGNRFLLQSLVNAVVDALPAGRILDLYAGVGLFAAAVAARGDAVVTAVEGDRSSARDLKVNAALLGPAVTPRQQPVEEFVATTRHRYDAVIVDPPRTGMSRAALAGAIALNAARVVYVSCDVATLARDARRLVDAGYRLTSMRAFDLFPNTAHVETLASFER